MKFIKFSSVLIFFIITILLHKTSTNNIQNDTDINGIVSSTNNFTESFTKATFVKETITVTSAKKLVKQKYTSNDIVDRKGSEDTNEMLVPLNSTTALICEPIFNENDANRTATWYKNGRALAKVTAHTNVILDNRNVKFDGPIPQVGFLIIANIQLGDEGEYWCARDDFSTIRGDRSLLIVAYIDQLSGDYAKLAYMLRRDDDGNDGNHRDMSLVFTCPETSARPKPTISWHYNGELIDFSTNRFEVIQNQLVIKHVTRDDIGLYECILTNFAGKTSARADVHTLPHAMARVALQKPRAKNASISCVGYFPNEILWFLIGCLSTSCVILLYLISGMIIFKCSKRGRRQRYQNTIAQNFDVDVTTRHRGRFAAFWRLLDASIDANRLPGFRKVVAPAPFFPCSNFTDRAVDNIEEKNSSNEAHPVDDDALLNGNTKFMNRNGKNNKGLNINQIYRPTIIPIINT